MILLTENINSVERYFEYDYIYFDALFLAIWLGFLIYKKEYGAIIFAATIAPIIYFIDAYIWWTTKTGDTYIREYFINATQILNNGFNYSLLKFGADFMMTISYALFNFAWIWLMFKYLHTQNRMLNSSIIIYTTLWLGSWLLIPLFSKIFDINNTIVHSIRNMESQNIYWVYITLISYILLFIYTKFNYKLMIKLFLIGIVAAFIMEFPLWLYNIRPNIDMGVFIFDTLFMINQSIPLLYIIFLFLNKKKRSGDAAL